MEDPFKEIYKDKVIQFVLVLDIFLGAISVFLRLVILLGILLRQNSPSHLQVGFTRTFKGEGGL